MPAENKEENASITLLAAYRSREKFSGRSTVSTWLIGILKHKIIDYYRKLTPESADASIEDFAYSTDSLFNEKEKWKINPGDWGGDPKNVYEWKELMTVIHTCLGICPKRWPKFTPCVK